MIPALTYIRQQYGEDHLYVYWANGAVRDLMSWQYKGLDQLPDTLQSQPVFKSSPVGAWHEYLGKLHMIQAHFALLKLPVPNEIPRAEILIDRNVPEYDYVVSPWSRSNHDHNKEWFEDRWEQLFSQLDGTIAVVGTSDDPRPWKHVSYEYGWPLKAVAGILQRTRKAVITIDNGISHLAFHAGVNEKHVQLYPACLPMGWVSFPGAIIQAEPKDVTVEMMLDLVKQCVSS